MVLRPSHELDRTFGLAGRANARQAGWVTQLTGRSARAVAGRRRGSPLRRYLPPQHGAWAMLLVPYLAGVVAAGWRWPDAPLAVAWLAGYPLSYFAFQAVKTGRPGRWRAQLGWYAAVALPLAAVVVWARPQVLWYAPAFAALWMVNAYYARRRRERALLNDFASVAASCLMVFVVATVAGAGPATVAGVFAVCAGYFAGTILYVKSMIRERRNPAYRRWSVGYHAAALAVLGWLGPAIAGLFALLLVRAWILPGRRMAPGRTGVVEIGVCLLLLAAVWLTWG